MLSSYAAQVFSEGFWNGSSCPIIIIIIITTIIIIIIIGYV
jgi:hypothetical protein